jgi:hypothetical protein
MLDTTQWDMRPDTTRDAANHNANHDAVKSEFAELVYADPAWLDAEFDAIMTANFGALVPSQCPPPMSPRSWPGNTGPRQPRRTAHSGDRFPTEVRSGRSSVRRERSPPRPRAPDAR